MFDYYGFMLRDRANCFLIRTERYDFVQPMLPHKDINIVQRSAYPKPVRYTSGGPP